MKSGMSSPLHTQPTAHARPWRLSLELNGVPLVRELNPMVRDASFFLRTSVGTSRWDAFSAGAASRQE